MRPKFSCGKLLRKDFIMAPSAPKNRLEPVRKICATCLKMSIFLGPGKRFLFTEYELFLGVFLGPLGYIAF